MEDLGVQTGFWLLFLMNVGKAIIVLVVGWVAAGWVSRLVRRRVEAHPRLDQTLGAFAANLVRWLLLVLVAIAVLNLFGIEATSVVAMLGAATLAIGLALQGTLSDFAAGFMLILFRPFKLGQYVDIGGTAGTVVDLNLFFTELKTVDNVQIVIPNGQAWGQIITNYSHHDLRRLDLDFRIDYRDDLDLAMAVVMGLAEGDGRVMDQPAAPWIAVTDLREHAVIISTRLWCQASDYWTLRFDLVKAVKENLAEKGFTVPYPHQVEVTVPREKAGPAA
ncbi:mechanosensitive ion channel family protein [Pontibaca methylaminivorans]|uniref:mechanosensitive ion channel family protein n=1 Tax=Pontibaca methylaminivorans TaxID=515897 RepID=UPI002FD8B416